LKQPLLSLDVGQVSDGLKYRWASRLTSTRAGRVFDCAANVVTQTEQEQASTLLRYTEIGSIENSNRFRDNVAVLFGKFDHLIENSPSRPRQQSGNIFHEERFGAQFENQTHVMGDERISWVLQITETHVAESLTWRTTNNHIDALRIDQGSN